MINLPIIIVYRLERIDKLNLIAESLKPADMPSTRAPAKESTSQLSGTQFATSQTRRKDHRKRDTASQSGYMYVCTRIGI